MKTIKFFSVGIVALLGLASCSDKFLEEKENFDNATQDLYNTYEGAKGRVTDVYSWCLPTVGDLVQEGINNYLSVSVGSNDMAGKSTEEYSGFSVFVDPTITLSSSAANSNNSVPDFFLGQQSNIQVSTYGRIRNINDAIEGISKSTLSESQKDELLGQCYFFRAWCYYNLMKWYGGVPLVKETQEPTEGAIVPRSSAKETKDFIISDLDLAAQKLAAFTTNGGWKSSGDYGRVTSGTALALKGRVLTLWCSPLFNRKGDQTRYQEALATMEKDLETINKCGYGLYQSGSNINGGYYASMFNTVLNNPEAVFVTLYNDIASDDGLDTQKNNTWERMIRPSNTGGSGKNASAMLFDMFPMSDGKVSKEVQATGNYTKLVGSGKTYNEKQPFVDRDPRFYRTFAIPGFRWAYNGTPKDAKSPQDGANYCLWNYVWYTKASDAGNVESGNAYGADNLLSSCSGIYVRKKSDDLDQNSPLYSYMATYTKGAAPFISRAPLMEIRYAEVLLNLAEVACGAGETGKAESYLDQVRSRAGESLAAASTIYDGTQGGLMSAILFERQVEFAYEGKRFDDCRRWMLYDGGTLKDKDGVALAGAPATWTLGGMWGSSTCDFLGVKPLNGQRRENLVFRADDKYDYDASWTTWNSDPIINQDYVPKVVADALGKTTVTDEEMKAFFEAIPTRKDSCFVEARKLRDAQCGIDLSKNFSEQSSNMTNLKNFYLYNLIRKERKGDGRDSGHNDLFINFRPKYYFLGLSSGAQTANKTLLQTCCWESQYAAASFDPLAE